MLKLLALLNGWKTYAGGIVQMLTGAGLILSAIAAMITKVVDPDNPIGMTLEVGGAAVLAGAYMFGKGLEAFGMAHKSEKQTAAIEDQTVEIKKQTAAAKVVAGEVQKQTEEIENQERTK